MSTHEFTGRVPSMAGVPEACWLFTRGSQSVRLLRVEDSRSCRLSLYGPGREVVTYEFANVIACMKRQAEIEQSLLAAGYQLAQPSANRRHERGTWRGADDRRRGNDSPAA